MAQNDIGIDLGTTTIIIAQEGTGVVLNQPSVVAMDTRKNSVLEAGDKARSLGIASSILVGDEAAIRRELASLGMDATDYEIIDVPTPVEAATTAVKLVADGRADILMKGLIDTNILLHAVLDSEHGLRMGKVLSHVALFELHHYDKLLAMTDGGINMATVAAAQLRTRHIEGAIVDGPFAIDNAINREAARTKGITSEVAGDCDVLLMPQIESGNVFYKALVFLGHAWVAGIVVGAKRPIVLTSRVDTEQAKLYSIALAMLVADSLQREAT